MRVMIHDTTSEPKQLEATLQSIYNRGGDVKFILPLLMLVTRGNNGHRVQTYRILYLQPEETKRLSLDEIFDDGITKANVKQGKSETVERRGLYWRDSEDKLHCRHGIILYGAACATCEANPDLPVPGFLGKDTADASLQLPGKPTPRDPTVGMIQAAGRVPSHAGEMFPDQWRAAWDAYGND